VSPSLNGDNSVVGLSPEKMDALQMFRGDTVTVKNVENGKETVCIALSEESCRLCDISMNASLRENLDLKLGDVVSISACSDIEYGRQIHVLPMEDTIGDFIGNFFEAFLNPYFLEAYRPVKTGDRFKVSQGMSSVEFMVIETYPAKCCIVAPETLIYCKGEPIQRELGDVAGPMVLEMETGCMEGNVKLYLKLSIHKART